MQLAITPNSTDQEAGFSLLELTIALLIFLIGILGLLQLITLSVSFNQRSRDTSLATALAQGKADSLLQLTFNNIATDSSLERGGIVPTTANQSPLPPTNPSPVGGFVDFFDQNGNQLSMTAVAKNANQIVPNNVYFVREWQICDACDAGLPTACTAGTPVCSTGQNLLKKITVTVTAINPAFRGVYPSATIIVYKSRIN